MDQIQSRRIEKFRKPIKPKGFLSGFSKVGFVENYGLRHREERENQIFFFFLWHVSCHSLYSCRNHNKVKT